MTTHAGWAVGLCSTTGDDPVESVFIKVINGEVSVNPDDAERIAMQLMLMAKAAREINEGAKT